MSLDLYERESNEHMRTLAPAQVAEVGLFDGFIRGTGLHTMRGLAKTARAIDLLGSIGPIVEDAFTGGTEAQDRYFQEHDEVFGSAVDYWTPKPREVGAAAEIAGMLMSTLPMVLAAPSLAVGSLQLSVAEDLVKKGVDPTTAQLVGASQAAGLGLGIYMPIFGQTITQRILVGGVGFNVVQGIGMRAAGEALLKGTPAEGEFLAFDPAMVTLDVLLGAAFGAITHLSPTQRAQGAEMWKRLEAFAKGFRQSDVDALAALRQTQHLNVDSMPGKPLEPVDIEHHAQRVRTALEQVLRDQPVDVESMPAPRFEVDGLKVKDNIRQMRELTVIAEDVRKAEELPLPPSRVQIPNGENLTPEQRAVELKARTQIEQDLEGQVRDYGNLPDSAGGKILNTDVARELFPDYRATRWLHSPSVHEPASALIKELYARAVTTADPLGLNMVTFTAGGTGAGKTSALKVVPLAGRIFGASQIVYDTNMVSFRSAADKIDLALANEKQVNIIYVGADPVEAFGRMLSRATRTGRTVPLVEHIKTHHGAAKTMEVLMDQYRGNDKVQFVFLDNAAAGKGKVAIINPENATTYLRSFDFTDLEPKLKETLDAELKAGRITEQIYRGVAGALTEAEGGPARPGGAEEPAGGGRPVGETAAGAHSKAVISKIVPREHAPVPISELTLKNGMKVMLEVQANNAFRESGEEIYTLDFTVKGPNEEVIGGGAFFPKADRINEWEGHYFINEEFRRQGAMTQVMDWFERTTGQKVTPSAATSADAIAFWKSRRTELEAPVAMRGEAVIPPPRGPRAEAAGAEGIDPLRFEAERFVEANPDLAIRVGQEADGTPIMKTARQFLEDAKAAAEDARQDVGLFEAAATCLFGRA